jgi:rubredoxin
MDLENLDISPDKARQRFFERVSSGSIALDGVMSPLTRELAGRFGTESVDMTFGWACTPMDWVCPACGRTKREIVRLNTNGHLMCRLVEHHDHMKDLVKDEFERQCKLQKTIVADEFARRFATRASQMISAYDNAIICDDCNAADPKAKGAVGTHKDFSYSPQEIRRFVRPQPNVPHEIDAEEAARIWQVNEETFALRLKIVERIAGIAATNTHWYQELPYGQRAETVYRHAEYLQGQYSVPGALYELTGDKRRPPSPDVSAWRRVKHKSPRVGPRPEDVAYLAKVSFGRHWSAVAESWRCPSCDRTKHGTVRKSNKGDWTFLLSDRSFYAPGERYSSKRAVVCGDCGLLASNLGKEACLVAEAATGSNYAQFLSVSEIARVVLPQPHARHNVKNDVADNLVMDLIERITLLEQQDD